MISSLHSQKKVLLRLHFLFAVFWLNAFKIVCFYVLVNFYLNKHRKMCRIGEVNITPSLTWARATCDLLYSKTKCCIRPWATFCLHNVANVCSNRNNPMLCDNPLPLIWNSNAVHVLVDDPTIQWNLDSIFIICLAVVHASYSMAVVGSTCSMVGPVIMHTSL